MGKSKYLLLVSLLGLLSACADNAPPGPGRERPSGPPPEAFTACEGKTAGAEVTFSGRNGESITATCEERDGELVAVPADAPPPRGH